MPRRELKRRLFRLFDEDGDGRLGQAEMLALARVMGFRGSDAEWEAEYAQVRVWSVARGRSWRIFLDGGGPEVGVCAGVLVCRRMARAGRRAAARGPSDMRAMFRGSARRHSIAGDVAHRLRRVPCRAARFATCARRWAVPGMRVASHACASGSGSARALPGSRW